MRKFNYDRYRTNKLKHRRFNFIADYLKTLDSKNMDIYEFGTHYGQSLLWMHDLFEDLGVNYGNMYGFDSFVGFPDFENEWKVDPNTYELWSRLDFNMVNNEGSIERLKEKIKSHFNKKPILIDGFFDKSLTNDIISEYNMKPASLVHIDCDLYTSTYTVLDFLIKNGLITDKTILLYDEWGPLFKPGEPFGEERAHNEICEKYGINYELVFDEYDKAIFKSK